MIDIDGFGEMLDEAAQSVPAAFFRELNGGILLLPQEKRSEYAEGDDLFTMGEYISSSALGRYIVIYYGSFVRVYGCLSESELRAKLEETLYHEFTHHLESLAGERGLERKDERQIREYKERKRKNAENIRKR